MSARFYDGSLVKAVKVGPVKPSTDPETFSKLYTLTYQQLEANYLRDMAQPGNVSGNQKLSAKRDGAFLVEWGDPEHIGGGVLEFTRTFAEVPRPRVEYELYNYNHQESIEGSLVEVPLLLRSRIVFQYVHTTVPEGIPVKIAPRYFMIGSSIYVRGNERELLLPEFLAEDETLFRWKGNIWGKKSRYVNRPKSLTASSA